MYKAIITHDIDFITKYKTFKNVLGAVRRGEESFISAFRHYINSKKDRTSDPFWSMEKMLEINLASGIETRFYFKTAITNPLYDLNDYKIDDSDIKDLLVRLNIKGATIGIHPSYETYLDKSQIKKEIDLLEAIVENKITHSRQHFLRYKNPETFVYLSECGIKVDSSIGPRKEIKTLNSTKEYNLIPGSNHDIKEQEFIMMDTHLISDPEKLLKELRTVVEQIKSEEGTACILWHNNNFDTQIKRETYKEVVRILQA